VSAVRVESVLIRGVLNRVLDAVGRHEGILSLNGLRLQLGVARVLEAALGLGGGAVVRLEGVGECAVGVHLGVLLKDNGVPAGVLVAVEALGGGRHAGSYAQDDDHLSAAHSDVK